jgi:transposase
MADIVNKSEIVRRLHDQGFDYVQIVKITGIRYNMVYNIIDRYKAHKEYKGPKAGVNQKELQELENVANEALKQMGVMWDEKTKQFVKEQDGTV